MVRVTDAHPAGTYTVTVRAFDSGGATTTKTFTLTVTTPATCNPVSFARPPDFGAGTDPASVAVGDFNGDGKQDLAVANFRLRQRVDLVGRWRGQFQRRHQLRRWRLSCLSSGGRFQWRWQARPRRGQRSCSNNVSILLGDGAGSFSAATNFGAGTNPVSVAVGDFNGDGKQDLAVANFGSDNVSILLGDGAGSFSAATNFGAGA